MILLLRDRLCELTKLDVPAKVVFELSPAAGRHVSITLRVCYELQTLTKIPRSLHPIFLNTY